MNKATERMYYDATTGTVVVECTKPDGSMLNVHVNSDAAEAIVQSFNDAKLEPPLGLEDFGVYDVRDIELISTEEKLLLDLWVLGGRKARFVLPASMHLQNEINTLSRELRRLLGSPQSAHICH